MGADIANYAEVISWWKVNITVFYTRFLPPTDQKCAEWSAFWQFFYYCPPSIQREIVKMWCQEFDIYLLANIYTYIYRYHPLDKRYGFSISVQPEITSLLKGFFSTVKFFFFQKLAGLWLVGEVVNHVELYGSKVAKGCSAFQCRSCY